MKSVFCGQLLLVLASTLLISRCRPRSESELMQVNQDNLAWFVGGDQPVKVCFHYSEQVKNQIRATGRDPLNTLAATTVIAYSKWFTYMRLKAIQPSATFDDMREKVKNLPHYTPRSGNVLTNARIFENDKIANAIQACAYPGGVDIVGSANVNRAFPAAIELTTDCAQAELQMYFGTTPSAPMGSLAAEPESVLGQSIVNPSTGNANRRTGSIVLADHGDSLSYQDMVEPLVWVTHEFGHVLGVPHVPGTIMDPEYLKDFASQVRQTRTLSMPIRQNLFSGANSIDQGRQLVLCEQSSDALSVGTSFGVLQGFAAPDIKNGLLNYIVYNLGTNDETKEIKMNVSPNGRKEIISSTDAIEIFRRPADVRAPLIENKSVVMNQWLNNKYLVKTSLNANGPDSSHTEVFRECPKAKLFLYEGAYVKGSKALVPVAWRPTLERSPEIAIKDFIDCLGPNQDLIEGEIVLSKTQNDWLNAIITAAATDPWELSGDSFEIGEVQLPKENLWCGAFHGSKNICIWRKGSMAIVRLQSGAKYKYHVLSPFLKKYSATAPQFKEHWFGGTQFATDMFKRGDYFTFRIGLKEDTQTSPNQIEYEFDVNLAYGVFYPLAKGILSKSQ